MNKEQALNEVNRLLNILPFRTLTDLEVECDTPTENEFQISIRGHTQ